MPDEKKRLARPGFWKRFRRWHRTREGSAQVMLLVGSLVFFYIGEITAGAVFYATALLISTFDD